MWQKADQQWGQIRSSSFLLQKKSFQHDMTSQSTTDDFTWKTSSSRILVPNTVMPLVSMEAWSLLRRGLTIFFLQSTMIVTAFFSTLMATRCHLVEDTVRRGERYKKRPLGHSVHHRKNSTGTEPRAELEELILFQIVFRNSNEIAHLHQSTAAAFTK